MTVSNPNTEVTMNELIGLFKAFSNTNLRLYSCTYNNGNIDEIYREAKNAHNQYYSALHDFNGTEFDNEWK